MIKIYLADIDISSSVSTTSLKIVDQIQNKANTCAFNIIVGGHQPFPNQPIELFDTFEIVSYSGTALVIKKKTLSGIEVLTHYKLREDQVIWLGIGLTTAEKVTISSLVESGDNINITLSTAALSAHSAGEFAGEKIFSGTVSTVSSDTSVLPTNVSYSVSCIDWTKGFDRKLANDGWENLNARQIIVGFVTEDLNNLNMVLDTMDYANDGAIQSAWQEINDAAASLPTIDASDYINGNGTSAGVFTWIYASGSADWRLAMSSTDYSAYVGVSSGQPIKGMMGLWIKFPATSIIASIRLYMSSDAGYTNMKGWYLRPIYADGDWHFCTIDMSKTADFTAGTMNWTAVVNVAIAIDQTASGSVKIDDWRIYEKEAFTFFNVSQGSTLTSFRVPFQKPTVVMEKLANLMQYSWWIDYDKDIHFISHESLNAPWSMTDGSEIIVDMSEAGWTGTVNSAWFLTGTSSQQTTTSAVNADLSSTFNLTLREDGSDSSTDDFIELKVYIETEVPTSISIQFQSTASDTYTYTFSSNLRLGFNAFKIAKSAFTIVGSPGWSSINKIRFYYTHGNNNPDVSVDSIWLTRYGSLFLNGDALQVHVDTTQLKNSQTVAGGTEDSSSTYSQVVQGDNAIREWILKTKFKNLVVKLDNNTSTDTCEAGTTTTNIKATAHGLVTDDYIINRTRSNATRKITVVDVDNFTVEAVTSQTNGDTFSKFASTQTVGVENLVDETTVNYVSNFAEKSIRAGSATATLPTTSFLLFIYTEKIDIVTQYKDNSSISRMKLLLGYGDGVFEGMIVNDESLDSRQGARDRARAEVDQYKNPLVNITFTTDYEGLKAGQLLEFRDSNKVYADSLLIQTVNKKYNQDYVKSSVTCATTLFGIIEYFQKLSLLNGGLNVADDIKIELVESEFAEVFVTESHSIGATEQVTATETQTTSLVNITLKDKVNKYQPLTAGDIIDALDVTTGWSIAFGASSVATNTGSIDGGGSVTFAKDTSSISALITKNYHPTNYDLTNKYLNIWYKIKDVTTLNKIRGIRILIGSDATVEALHFKITNPGELPSLAMVGNWCQLKLNFNAGSGLDVTTGGTLDITSVNWIRLEILTYNATDTLAEGDFLWDYIYTTDATIPQTVYGVGAYG